ncbi:MAG: radical SAM protein [Candidatus Omnitrophota bacterium]|nr:radical SAM protein [Candidatus Omnitrophota bacterium]
MKKEYPRLLVSNKRGRIFCHPELEATGMAAGHFFRIYPEKLIELPGGSILFMTPNRAPIGYDRAKDNFTILNDKYLAVAAFISPGYAVTNSVSYREAARSKALPLFSYAAASFYKGRIFVSALRVDRGLRHDSRFINMALVRKNIARFRRIFPDNALVRHLERCALSYGCCGAQNFFLSKHECPLPASPFCNARCAGCISHQERNMCSASQPRIRFIPDPEEISEIALFHIANVKDAVVSFGQGCEGEGLLVSDTIEKSIRLIRQKTSKGIINMNTNASSPGALAGLFDAGLDSIRVSLNSAQELYYARYYRPLNYAFQDVLKSIKLARRKNRFVSINYLTMPGFTDWEEEFSAFKKFIENYGVDMIQWRNLNFDPLLYFKELKVRVARDKLIGIGQVINSLKESFPNLMMGCFNPSKRKMSRGGNFSASTLLAMRPGGFA